MPHYITVQQAPEAASPSDRLPLPERVNPSPAAPISPPLRPPLAAAEAVRLLSRFAPPPPLDAAAVDPSDAVVDFWAA
jgi:hypothetical protein